MTIDQQGIAGPAVAWKKRPAAGPALGTGLLPGLLLTAAIAGMAYALRQLPGVAALLSPLILSIVLGMAFHNLVGTPARCAPGIAFTLRRILRVAIIMLGLQLTTSQLIAVGGVGLAITAATLMATFVFTGWLGRRLGVEAKLAQLIGAGTSICGASAVIAVNTVTEGADEDVAYAVACVTVFGGLAMFLYPMLPALLHMDAGTYGLWAGASIHEIAQVIAAAYQHGPEAGDLATIVKLSRVAMLAPLVLGLGFAINFRAGRRDRDAADPVRPAPRAAPPIPWFVVGFIAMVGLNSLDLLPALAKDWSIQVTGFLLAMALAAMGLATDIGKLRAKGWRPLALGAGAWGFIALFSLSLIELTR